MATLDEIIQREINPFDPVSFYTGNFWQESQKLELTVDSIHHKELAEITQLLAQVAEDRQTRSILLLGDRGSGKSYLLSRLKQQLNSKAFFAYIGPWVEKSGQIWRHILRHTVDSLMRVPDGQEESQLLLWLKGLSAFGDRSLKKQILGERRLFIHNLRGTYPSGIYQPNEFFGVLYDLTNPDLYYTACDWLCGNDLDEDSLKAIRVKRSIETETDAKNILGNFGQIAANTQPIVLCFDQIDKVAEPPDGYQELQSLFTVNTTIHNERLKNFLMIISLITNTWRQHQKNILEADKDRICKGIILKHITGDEAESIWQKRLYPLHQQATEKPDSPIYPLTRQGSSAEFPGGKTFPRYALKLARNLYQEYKLNLGLEGAKHKKTAVPEQPKTAKKPIITPKVNQDPIAAFRLLWEYQLKKTQQKIPRIRYFSNPELVQMLREALEVLEVPEIQSRLLPSQKYDSYSLSCQLPNFSGKVGFVWTEDGNLRNFFSFMNCCLKAMHHELCQKLYLIRASGLGNAKNKGYKLYKQIFTGTEHIHVSPSLESVQYLATYHNLVNAAAAGELVVGDRSPNIAELQSLMRSSNILSGCTLLQKLDVIPGKEVTHTEDPSKKAKQFILSLIETQQMLGRDTLINNTVAFDLRLDETQINQIIEQLILERTIQIVGPPNNHAAQFICLLPKQ